MFLYLWSFFLALAESRAHCFSCLWRYSSPLSSPGSTFSSLSGFLITSAKNSAKNTTWKKLTYHFVQVFFLYFQFIPAFFPERRLFFSKNVLSWQMNTCKLLIYSIYIHVYVWQKVFKWIWRAYSAPISHYLYWLRHENTLNNRNTERCHPFCRLFRSKSTGYLHSCPECNTDHSCGQEIPNKPVTSQNNNTLQHWPTVTKLNNWFDKN